MYTLNRSKQKISDSVPQGEDLIFAAFLIS